VAAGTPEEVAEIDASYTGQFLRKALKSGGSVTVELETSR
jgi:hypothetical protein